MSMGANKESADQKRKRLEKALRENLRKRKSQQRERENQQEEIVQSSIDISEVPNSADSLKNQ